MDKDAVEAAKRAAESSRRAADALEDLAQSLDRDDIMGAINSLTKAMAAFADLEQDLTRVRDIGLVSIAASKPPALA